MRVTRQWTWLSVVALAACVAGMAASVPAEDDRPCCGAVNAAGRQLERAGSAERRSALGGARTRKLGNGRARSWRRKRGPGHTHCSAFTAAAAMRLGIYLLRPPEHVDETSKSAVEIQDCRAACIQTSSA